MAGSDYDDWLDKYAKDQGIDGDVNSAIPQDLQDAQAFYESLGNQPLSPDMQAKVNEDEDLPAPLAGAPQGHVIAAAGIPDSIDAMADPVGDARKVPSHDVATADKHSWLQMMADEYQRQATEAKKNKADRAIIPGATGGTSTGAGAPVGGGGNAHVMADFALPGGPADQTANTDQATPSGIIMPNMTEAQPTGPSTSAPLVQGAGTQQGLANALGDPTVSGPAGFSVAPPNMDIGKPAIDRPKPPPPQVQILKNSAHDTNVDRSGAGPMMDGKGATDNVDLSGMNGGKPTPTLHFANGGAGAGTGGAPSTPLNIPGQRVVGGGWARTDSPEIIAQQQQLADQRHELNAQNELDARLANQKYAEFYAAQTAKRQADEEQARQQQLVAQRARARADSDYQAAQKVAAEAKIDPDKIYGPNGGGRVLAALGVGLGAFGAGLTHSPNDALDMLKSRIESSMAAQKAEMNSKHKTADNAYKRLLDATGDEKSADSAFRQAGYATAASQAEELDTGAKDTQLGMGLRNLQQQEAQSNFDYRRATTGRVQQQVVGGIPKAVQDEADKISNESKGTVTPEQSVARAFRLHGMNVGGDIGASWENAGRAGTSGRAVGPATKLQLGIAHADNAEQSILAAIEAKKHASLSPSKTAGDAVDRVALVNDIATGLSGGNAISEEDHKAANAMVPEDMNSYDPMGKDMARLNAALRAVRVKKSTYSNVLKNIPKDPFTPAPTDEGNAAGAGATED
jgi:hypothetical protein